MKRSEWRAKRDKQVTLPSGNVVTLRKVSLQQLMKQGQIPAPLAGFIEPLLKTKSDPQISMSEFPQIGEVEALVVMACVVEPKIVNDLYTDARWTSEDEIPLSDFDDEDIHAIYEWANGRASQLAPFRAETGESVDAASDGDGIRTDPRATVGGNGHLDGVSAQPLLPPRGDGAGSATAGGTGSGEWR
jgi:hypothetical protein